MKKIIIFSFILIFSLVFSSIPTVIQASSSIPQTSFHYGAQGSEVQKLQDALVNLGYLQLTADQYSGGYGIFGRKTRAALALYQADNGIDGNKGYYYGSLTRNSLVNNYGGNNTNQSSANPSTSCSTKLFALGDSLAQQYQQNIGGGGSGANGAVLNNNGGHNQVGASPLTISNFAVNLSPAQLDYIKQNGVAIFSGTNNLGQLEYVKTTVDFLINQKGISPSQIYLANVDLPNAQTFNSGVDGIVSQYGVRLIDIKNLAHDSDGHPELAGFNQAIAQARGCNSANPTTSSSGLPNQPVIASSFSGGSTQTGSTQTGSAPTVNSNPTPATTPSSSNTNTTGPAVAPGVAINGTLNGIAVKYQCNPTAAHVTKITDCRYNYLSGMTEKITGAPADCSISGNPYQWACGVFSFFGGKDGGGGSTAIPNPYATTVSGLNTDTQNYSAMRWNYAALSPSNQGEGPTVLTNYFLQLYNPASTGCVNTYPVDWGPDPRGIYANPRSYDLSRLDVIGLGNNVSGTSVQQDKTIIYSRLIPRSGNKVGLTDTCFK